MWIVYIEKTAKGQESLLNKEKPWTNITLDVHFLITGSESRGFLVHHDKRNC